MIGVLTLDTKFPRIIGDAGCKATYNTPVIFQVVTGVGTERGLRGEVDDIIKPLVEAGRSLLAAGATTITSTCGFLSIVQRRLLSELKRPVFASSLLLLPLISNSTLGKIGIITANSRLLSRAHIEAAGLLDLDRVIVGGMEHETEFSNVILGDSEQLNCKRIEAEVLNVVGKLIKSNSDIRSILFECHNLPPYAEAVRDTFGLPVYDFLTLLKLIEDVDRQPSFHYYNAFR